MAQISSLAASRRLPSFVFSAAVRVPFDCKRIRWPGISSTGDDEIHGPGGNGARRHFSILRRRAVSSLSESQSSAFLDRFEPQALHRCRFPTAQFPRRVPAGQSPRSRRIHRSAETADRLSPAGVARPNDRPITVTSECGGGTYTQFGSISAPSTPSSTRMEVQRARMSVSMLLRSAGRCRRMTNAMPQFAGM